MALKERKSGVGRGLAHAFFVPFLGAIVACGDAHDPSSPVTDWLYYYEHNGAQERYLSVQLDDSYESADSAQHATQAGTLIRDQHELLAGLLSEAQFDAYAEDALSDCESASVPIAHVHWREQRDNLLHVRNGCWARAEVKGNATQHFLDVLSELQVTLMK